MCQKSYRQCIYESSPLYAPQTESSTEHKSVSPISAASQVHTFATSLGPSCNISPYGKREYAELSAIKNFPANIGKGLSGHFADHVWCHVVPQVAQHEPSILHAVVAIHILDSSLRLGQKGQGNAIAPEAAIRQYSKAIQELNGVIKSGERTRCQDVVLLSCILFAVLECLQSHHKSALRHISGGLKLLAEWKTDAKSHDGSHAHRYFDHAMVQPIFISLDSQAVQLGAVVLRERLVQEAVFDDFNTPTSFSGIREAHVSLSHLFNRFSHWEIWIQPETSSDDRPEAEWIISEREKIREQLRVWDSAFRTLSKRLQHEPGTLLLLLQRKVIQVLWEQDMDGLGEMGWDKHNALFRQAVGYAEAYMEMTTAGRPHDSTQERKFILTMTEDIVLPLFCISTKCRHSATRRRALEILKTCNRQEGVWNSYDCASIAEELVGFEERDASDDGTVQESARIYTIDFDLEHENAQNISYKKLAYPT